MRCNLVKREIVMKTLLFFYCSLIAMEPGKQITCPECNTVVIHIDQARDIEISTPEPIRKMKERRKTIIIAATASVIGAGISAAVTVTTKIYNCEPS